MGGWAVCLEDRVTVQNTSGSMFSESNRASPAGTAPLTLTPTPTLTLTLTMGIFEFLRGPPSPRSSMHYNRTIKTLARENISWKPNKNEEVSHMQLSQKRDDTTIRFRHYFTVPGYLHPAIMTLLRHFSHGPLMKVSGKNSRYHGGTMALLCGIMV